MIQIPTWKRIAILIVCLLGLLYSAPNVMPERALMQLQGMLPSWAPVKTVNLGLDLQGGAHLLVEADVSEVISERANGLRSGIRSILREEGIQTSRITVLPNGVRFTLNDRSQTSEARRLLRQQDQELEVLVNDETGVIEATWPPSAIDTIRDQAVNQSIEIIRRRIDETGTREPVIQRQGEDRILVQLPGVDDPQRIKALIGKTAKLSFHLVAEDQRPGSLTTKDLPYAERQDERLYIQRQRDITGDMLTNAQTGFDQNGLPVVNFQLNAVGARKFCSISSDNVGKLFAIVLDNEIISAPVFRSPICGGQAQISGNFTVSSANDLALLLRAGALPAELTFVEERTVGPSLGADSIASGQNASLIALALVLFFMAIVYKRFGIYADIALVANIALIFALLSMMQATLTLPGIAGIVLTIGMAVDANVLIFERIKEELRNGRSVMAAIDTGYSRAFGTIIDANITTLIAAAILFSFGTGPIKGFAVTLGIGVLTSLFTSIMVTRLMVVMWLHGTKPKELRI